MIREKWNKLLADLRQQERLLVAFSGGTDSTFLLAAARTTLGRQNVLAVTAISASLPEREKRATEQLAQTLDVVYEPVATDEMSNPEYQANPSNRCFFCKDELFAKLAPLAKSRSMTMVDGFNASDRADYRPGFQASQQWGVKHPLDDAELYKEDIRILSRWLKLSTWNKPASPCLSSRIPYGTPVTEPVLRQIEKAEDVVRAEGFRVVRVRHYGPEARIEVPPAELSRLLAADRWSRVERGILACGYQSVVADPRGFKSGNLNFSKIPETFLS